MTATEAIERSIGYNEIVYLTWTRELEDELMAASYGDVVAKGVHEFWGGEEGDEWRVHLDLA